MVEEKAAGNAGGDIANRYHARRFGRKPRSAQELETVSQRPKACTGRRRFDWAACSAIRALACSCEAVAASALRATPSDTVSLAFCPASEVAKTTFSSTELRRRSAIAIASCMPTLANRKVNSSPSVRATKSCFLIDLRK